MKGCKQSAGSVQIQIPEQQHPGGRGVITQSKGYKLLRISCFYFFPPFLAKCEFTNMDFELLPQKGTLGILQHISCSFSSKKGRQAEECKEQTVLH